MIKTSTLDCYRDEPYLNRVENNTETIGYIYFGNDKNNKMKRPELAGRKVMFSSWYNRNGERFWEEHTFNLDQEGTLAIPVKPGEIVYLDINSLLVVDEM
jgi:hypothetical protein